MNTESTLLLAIQAQPKDRTAWLALADYYEESDQLARAEFLRLRLELQEASEDDRMVQENRVRELLEAGIEPVVPLRVNSIEMHLALIPAGSTWMGGKQGEPNRHPDEDPRHIVQVTKPFFIGVYPVTQAQYLAVMGSNPSVHQPSEGSEIEDTSNHPVENVPWAEAVEFCDRLSARERRTKRKYRLPTEAEWEYACRAGTTTTWYFGDKELTKKQANINGSHPTPVGSYPPNAFGLYDMAGNVWQWCSDWFDEDYFPGAPPIDPTGPAEGYRRSQRGGSFHYGPGIARSSYRYRSEPDTHGGDYGFRVVLDVK